MRFLRFLPKILVAIAIIQLSIAVSNIKFLKTFQFSKTSSLKSFQKKAIHSCHLPHYRIAIIIPAWDAGIDSIIDGFQDTLNDQKVFTATFKRYCSNGAWSFNGDRVLLRSQVEDIFLQHYDLIYSIGTEPTKMLKEVSEYRRDNTPIVFSHVKSLVERGIVKSLENSGNNVTGVPASSDSILYGNLVSALFKGLKTALIVYNPTSLGGGTALEKEKIQKLFEARDIKVKSVEVFKVDEIVQRTESNLDDVDIILTLHDSTTFTGVGHLVRLCNTYQIPLVTPFLDASAYGVAVTFGTSEYAVGSLAGDRARQILAEGKKPSEIPISDIGRTWNLLINSKAANRQRLTLDKNMNFLLRYAQVVGKKNKV